MSSRDDLFKETPSAEHAAKVFASVQGDLEHNKKLSPAPWRGRWALVFTLGLAGLLLFVRRGRDWSEMLQPAPTEESLGAIAFMDAIEDDSEIDLLGELELVEQLEELEQWENS